MNRLERLPDRPSSVLTAQADRRLRAWDVEGGECWSDLRLEVSIHDFAILARDRVVVAGGFFEQQGKLLVCDLKNESVIYTLRENIEYLSAMVSDDRGLVIVAKLYGGLSVWDVEAGNCRYTLRPPESSFQYASNLKVLPNHLLLAKCNDGARIWNLETGEYNGLQSQDFEALTEKCAPSAKGIEWLGALYPLSGKPKVVVTSNRAVLTEEQSGIVHIRRLRGRDADRELSVDTTLNEAVADFADPVTEETAISGTEFAVLALRAAKTLTDARDFEGAWLGLQRAEALLFESANWGLALRCLVQSCLISGSFSRNLEPSAVERLVMSLDNPLLDPSGYDPEIVRLDSESDSLEFQALKRLREIEARGGPPHLSSLFLTPRRPRVREPSFSETKSSTMAGTTKLSSLQLADTIGQARAILNELASENPRSDRTQILRRNNSVEVLSNRAIALVGLSRFTEARPLLIEAERLARRKRRDLLPILLRATNP